MPLVSVIIPAYNRAHCIERAIDSVRQQTFTDFEIVICDDGSSDNTQEVLEAIGDPRIKCVRHETNLGPGAARNSAIEAACGKYLAFLDSDDEWLPDKLEKQVSAMEDLSDEWGCIYGSARMFRTDRSSTPVITTATRSGDVYKDLVTRKLTIITPTFMIRRKCLDQVGMFDTTLPRHQDLDLFYRLLEVYKLAAVEDVVSQCYLITRKPGLTEKALLSKRRLLAKHKETFRKRLGYYWTRYIHGYVWLESASESVAAGRIGRGMLQTLRALACTPLLPVRLYARLARALWEALLGKSGSPDSTQAPG